MSDFLYHEACPQCGSSDGRAVYQDGGTHCFVCKTTTRSGRPSFAPATPKQAKYLPYDLSTEYGPEAIEWTERYGIRVEELIRHNVRFSKRQKRLYFLFKEGWQARNFWQGSPKYTSSGNLDGHIYSECTLLSGGLDRLQLLIVTEDCLSAIKIARQSDASPCLTSGLPMLKLKRLAAPYKAVKVWLDGDMFHNSVKMTEQLKLLGKDAQAIWTPNDPKCYSDEEVTQILLTGKCT
jgi:hypothetical protein